MGFSITEVLVVVAIIAVLVGIGVPAAKQMQKSFESTAGVKNAISAALGNARAIALKEGKYAGVRFQQDAAGRQYMVLVIHDYPGTGLANGFRAVKGRKPLPLPENVGVMDFVLVDRVYNPGNNSITISEGYIAGDEHTNDEKEITDMNSFSIVFSKTGKLVTHEVRIVNRHGITDVASSVGVSSDDVFNKKSVVDGGSALFYQDDYFSNDYGVEKLDLGLGPEMSRKFFVIVIKNEFGKVAVDRRWSEYLVNLEKFYINPYSGEVIN